jgi:RimJ/RimL family protein N-acetyltransferase
MSVIFYEGRPPEPPGRIFFRPIEPEDEPVLRRWINDPRIWSTLGQRTPANSVREMEWINNYGKSTTDYVFGVALKDGNRLVGSIGLHDINPINHKAILGIMIGEVECQNQGYGTEAVRLALRYAFEELNLNRVALHVFDHNPRAIHVYEKAGFVFEGRQRQAFFRHGKFRDVLCYAVLREEWATSASEAAAAEAAGAASGR